MFVTQEDVERDILDEKSSRKILAYNEEIMMVEVSFDEGGIGEVHAHPHTQISYVAGGCFEFQLWDNKRILHEGDSVLIPSGVRHGLKALQDSIIVDVFTPCRKYFL